MAEPVALGPAAEHEDAEGLPLVPARMLNAFVYCPRSFFLEWIHGEWAESEDTLLGSMVHTRVDEEAGTLPTPEELVEGATGRAQSLMLSAPVLGIVAKVDLVEVSEAKVVVVDYKKGRPGREGPREPELVQLCAQIMALRENGYPCQSGVLYYAETKQRVPVALTPELEAKVLEALAKLRETAAAGQLPPPLVDSPKCVRCSLAGICLPDETNLLTGREVDEVRRLAPAKEDAAPLYILEQGACLGKDGDRLVIRSPEGEPASLRLLDISQVSLYGNVQVSSQTVRALLQQGIPIFHHTYGGWLVGVTAPVMGQNVHLRIAQYTAVQSEAVALPLAKALVAGKLRNQRTILRRNHNKIGDHVLQEFSRLARAAGGVRSFDELLGIEGVAGRLYFRHFADILKDPMGFELEGRRRRPAPDPVNALLSFLYSLLLKDAVKALLAVGLDPYAGIYHRPRPGRPSLALDLMEEFRPLVADSAALRLLNSGMLGDDDFLRCGPACALKDPARRKVVEAYESRMNSLVQHPIFGYRATYRRTLEIQARLLGRALLGELASYPPFCTR